MVKFTCFCLFFLNFLLVAGQNNKIMSIDLKSARPLNLSSITEKVVPIPLEDQVSITNISLTDEYLFVSSIRSFTQYDLTGKFIRRINCGGFISDNISNASSKCHLSLYNDKIIASFSHESEIYQIEQDKIITFTEWNTISLVRDSKTFYGGTSSFIGDYLFISYCYDYQSYFYLKNLKTSEKYNFNQLVDDVFHTSGDCNIYSLNKKGYFYFIKGKSEINENSIRNIPIKNGHVVFIAKVK